RDVLTIIAGRDERIINRDMMTELKKLSQELSPEMVFDINSLVKRGASGLSYGIKIQHLVPVLLAEGKKVAQ
ncbi:MAG: hypothetical protein GXO70_03720, partial [Acidobacteria bacterium]|nr:hypothetical protein [Acidobacteriota bacterium]